MLTPQKPQQKAPRRSPRRQEVPQQFESIEPTASLSEDSATPQTDHNTPAVSSHPKNEGQKSKRKPQSHKKHRDGSKSDGGSSQPVIPQHEKMKATPVKQAAYAGPTFHASPAPSALPIPSFYSKSVPGFSTADLPDATNNQGDDSTSAKQLLEVSPGNGHDTNKRESTPLDWMFDIARQSKGTSRAESPSARSVNPSALGDSPYSRSPAPQEGSTVFPFELEGNDTDSGDVGSYTTTPYRERIEALRPASSAAATASLDERERQAKSEALKRLLMNSQPPRSASASPHLPEADNPFNARPPQARNFNHAQPQMRHHSGPSTPVPFYGPQVPSNPAHYFPPMPPMPNNHQSYNQNYNPSIHRPPSSHLRHVYRPGTESNPVELATDRSSSQPLISTARKQPAQNAAPRRNCNPTPIQPSTEQITGHKSKPSAQQLEDDLKRFLKLDLASKG